MAAKREPKGPFSPGDYCGEYEIIREIGSGGMGVVYRACSDAGAVHALKVRRIDKAYQKKVERFKTEIKALIRIRNRYVVRFFKVGQHKDFFWVSMELVEGETLADVMERKAGFIALPQVVSWGLEAAEALVAMHRAGVVHRDIKPDNIMVKPDGSIKVLDFGISKLTRAKPITCNGVARPMTPGYMSPEHTDTSGKMPDGRMDVFCLGIILWKLLVGSHPFNLANKTNEQMVHTIATEDVPRLLEVMPGCDEALARVVQGMLRRDKNQRATAEQVFDALGKIQRRLDAEVVARTERMLDGKPTSRQQLRDTWRSATDDDDSTLRPRGMLPTDEVFLPTDELNMKHANISVTADMPPHDSATAWQEPPMDTRVPHPASGGTLDMDCAAYPQPHVQKYEPTITRRGTLIMPMEPPAVPLAVVPAVTVRGDTALLVMDDEAPAAAAPVRTAASRSVMMAYQYAKRSAVAYVGMGLTSGVALCAIGAVVWLALRPPVVVRVLLPMQQLEFPADVATAQPTHATRVLPVAKEAAAEASATPTAEPSAEPAAAAVPAAVPVATVAAPRRPRSAAKRPERRPTILGGGAWPASKRQPEPKRPPVGPLDEPPPKRPGFGELYPKKKDGWRDHGF